MVLQGRSALVSFDHPYNDSSAADNRKQTAVSHPPGHHRQQAARPGLSSGPVFAQAMCLRESGAPSAASCAVKFRQAKKIFKAMKTSTCQTALSLMMRMRGRCRNLHALRNDIHIEVFNRFVVSMHYTQALCGGFGNGLLLSIILKHGDWHLCQSPDPSPFPQSSI